MKLGEKPTGRLCLGPSFCWYVYGWRPSRLQQVLWSWCFGVTWHDE